jgi:hypothetical protein
MLDNGNMRASKNSTNLMLNGYWSTGTPKIGVVIPDGPENIGSEPMCSANEDALHRKLRIEAVPRT